MYPQSEVKRFSLIASPGLLFCWLVCTVTMIASLQYSQTRETPSATAVRQRIVALMSTAMKERERITPEGRTLWVPVPLSQEISKEVQGYGNKAVPILAEYLKSGTSRERLLAVQFLGALGGNRVTEPLLTVIRSDPEPSLREEALTYIAQLPWEVASPILKQTSTRNSDSRVREKARYLMGRHEAIEVQSPSESFIRKRIAILIGHTIQMSEAVTSDGVRIQTAARPSNEDIEEIKRYGDAAVSILAEYLSSEDGRQKNLAIRFLGLLGGNRIIAPLEKVIRQDPSPSVRETALRWLTNAPWDVVSPIITQAAQNDPDPGVRQAARELLDARNPR